tara:strand:- start:111 stop:497 length:387 start_codon:yes stop_codon:yes gene_type:complete
VGGCQYRLDGREVGSRVGGGEEEGAEGNANEKVGSRAKQAGLGQEGVKKGSGGLVVVRGVKLAHANRDLTQRELVDLALQVDHKVKPKGDEIAINVVFIIRQKIPDFVGQLLVELLLEKGAEFVVVFS